MTPSIMNLVRCNTDGTSVGVSGTVACDGIFMDHNSNLLGSFSLGLEMPLF